MARVINKKNLQRFEEILTEVLKLSKGDAGLEVKRDFIHGKLTEPRHAGEGQFGILQASFDNDDDDPTFHIFLRMDILESFGDDKAYRDAIALIVRTGDSNLQIIYKD